MCKDHDATALLRLINAEASPAHLALADAFERLISNVADAVTGLHWKDFEVLVDLVFRQAGWRRRSILGESMKYVDLELVEPVTQDAYQVQVKSRATESDFLSYAERFSNEGFRRLYFVVHSPAAALTTLSHNIADVELVLPDRLARLIVDGGLVNWVLDKVR